MALTFCPGKQAGCACLGGQPATGNEQQVLRCHQSSLCFLSPEHLRKSPLKGWCRGIQGNFQWIKPCAGNLGALNPGFLLERTRQDLRARCRCPGGYGACVRAIAAIQTMALLYRYPIPDAGGGFIGKRLLLNTVPAQITFSRGLPNWDIISL